MAYTDFQNGFNVQTRSAIDKRIYLTKAEMLNAEKQFPLLPKKYFAVCSENGRLYLYNADNTATEETGKYLPVEATLAYDTEAGKIAFLKALSENAHLDNLSGTIDGGEVSEL